MLPAFSEENPHLGISVRGSETVFQHPMVYANYRECTMDARYAYPHSFALKCVHNHHVTFASELPCTLLWLRVMVHTRSTLRSMLNRHAEHVECTYSCFTPLISHSSFLVHDLWTKQSAGTGCNVRQQVH